MTTVSIHELQPGMRINVRAVGNPYWDTEPKFRTITKLQVKRMGGVRWTYWHWIPENSLGECGYSGVMSARCADYRFELA